MALPDCPQSNPPIPAPTLPQPDPAPTPLHRVFILPMFWWMPDARQTVQSWVPPTTNREIDGVIRGMLTEPLGADLHKCLSS
jgi:hypothetical protein